MRFLADENIPLASIASLRGRGHDVVSVREFMPGTSDAAVLALAAEDGRVLVTFDRDFGRLVYKHNLPAPAGLGFLRFIPTVATDVASVVLELLDRSDLVIEGKISVVDRERVRQRPLPVTLSQASDVARSPRKA